MTPEWEALADQPIDDVDRAILGDLRAGLDAVDPLPAGLTDRIKFALTVQALEAEIADIVSQGSLSGVRADEYDRASTITFASDGFTATISVSPRRGGTLSIHGWTSEPSTEVELRERSRSQRTTSDLDGRFEFIGLESGLVNLLFRRPSGPPPVITPALEI